MKSLKNLIQSLFLIFIFFLPWQTRWIYLEGSLNGGFWEYGTFALYATELLLGVIILLSLIYIFKQNFTSGKTKHQKSNWLGLTILFLASLAFIIPALTAINSNLAFYKLTHIVLAFSALFLVASIKLNLVKASYAFVFSGLLQSLLAIHQFVTQKVLASKLLGIAAQDPNILGTPVIETSAGRILRSFGSLPHPNILAGYLVVCLLLIVAVYTLEKNLHLKAVLNIIFIFTTIALLTTASRAAIIGFLLSFFAYLILINKHRIELRQPAYNFVILTLIIFIIFSALKPELIQTRLLGQNRLEQKSNIERIAGYNQALTIYKNNWLLGVGPGNYTLALHQVEPNQESWYYQPVHNAVLLHLIEFGTFKFILVGIYLFSFIYLFKKKIFSLKPTPLSLSLYSSLIALFIISMFDHYLYSMYFGLMLLFIVIGMLIQTLLTTPDKNI